MDKKIVIVGVLDNEASTNVWMARSFKNKGYEVIPINYRKLIQKYGQVLFGEILLDTIRKNKPYLVVFCKCNGVDPNLVKMCTCETDTWLWFMDSHNIALQNQEIIQHAVNCIFSSCTSEVCTQLFRENGASNCFTIREGIDTKFHNPVEVDDNFKADVSFIGGRTEERDRLKKLLENEGLVVRFYGDGYTEKRVSMKEWAKICSSSKFMLSLNTFNDIPGYFSGRIFEYMGSGACVLHYDPTNTISEVFKPRKEILTFKDDNELVDIIKNTSDKEAKRIAKNGYDLVHREYTFDNVVDRILSIVDREKTASVKTLFCAWHGLGDYVMLLPALRKYKKRYPNREIYVSCMKRYGEQITDLYAGIDYIDGVVPIHSDAWNSYDNYSVGVGAVVEEAKKFCSENGFGALIAMPSARYFDGFRLHKSFRFAYEARVWFDSVEDLEPNLVVTEEDEREAQRILEPYRLFGKPIVLLHNDAGNPPKEMTESETREILSHYQNCTIIELGKKSIEDVFEIDIPKMSVSKALVKNVDAVIAIDSVIMHIAGAFKKDLLAVFKTTPVIQAIPLTYTAKVAGIDNDVTQIRKSKEYKQEMYNYFANRNAVNTSYNSSIDGKQGGKRDSNRRWRYIQPFLAERLKSEDNTKRILDIGCNNGFFSIMAAKEGYDVLGVDNDREMIDSAIKQGCGGVVFEHLEEDLLNRLKKFKDKEFEFTFYMSVHHHMYEQYGEKIADAILKEIGRISKSVIFDMGQSDELGSVWTTWKKFIPRFEDNRKELPIFISNKLDITEYSEVICSETIHGTDRWLFLFSDYKPDHLVNKKLYFSGIGYSIVEQIYNKRKRIENVRYFVVENSGKKYFVKEILYNRDMSYRLYPNDSLITSAKSQFDRCKKVEDVTDNIVKAIDINDNFILFEYFDWPDLITIGSITTDMFRRIEAVARKIWKSIGQFDFNVNNVLVSGTEFKFIDFELGECDFNERLSRFKKLVNGDNLS